jgi:hypothetical protein
MIVRIRMSGLAVVVLGVWGALVPFVGPYFHFAWHFGGQTWTWSESFATLDVAAGACAVLGGLAMLGSSRRSARLGGLAALVGGGWFVTGLLFHPLWSSTTLGPSGYGRWMTIALQLGYHAGIGILVVAFAAYALGASTPTAARPVPSALEPAEPEPIENRELLPVA